MAEGLLKPETSLLLVVDLQEKFVPIVRDARERLRAAAALARAAGLLGVPVLVSEQYPKGLGRTVKELKDALPPGTVFAEKTAFGCLADEALAARLRSLGRRQVLVCGLEAHVCVSQTVHQLLEAGYEAHVAEDAVAARSEENRRVGLEKMRRAGAVPSCAELALFEWLGGSRHPRFKEVQALIK